MMKRDGRRKVMTIVGTRPELIKMSLVIERLDLLTNHVLVHTGQNYDYSLNEVFFKDLGIRKPDYFLGVAAPTPAKSISNIIEHADDIFESEKPDALMIYGDTNSGLAVIAAKRRKIPVFHMEAGNRCFDQRVPEELNRKIIDHLSDVNMTLTEHARRYLLAEGLPPERTFVVGSHMAEVLRRFEPSIKQSDVLQRLGLEERKFFLVSAHREENVDSVGHLRDMLASLDALAAKYGWPIVVSTHPRTRKRIDEIGGIPANGLVRFMEPFGFIDYVRLQLGAACVISDSGTITEEASLLDLPAVTLRDAHERPEGMDAGTLIMSRLGSEAVLDAVACAMLPLSVDAGGASFAGKVRDYEAYAVSAKVVKIVLSYIDYVNRVVWSKPDTRSLEV